MPFHFAESAASAALGKCAGGPDGSAAFASYAFYGEEPRDPTLVGGIAAPAESEVGRGVPGGPRMWSPSSAATVAKSSKSTSVSGPARRAGVATRVISSANPGGEVIGRLRQPPGPALIVCGVERDGVVVPGAELNLVRAGPHSALAVHDPETFFITGVQV
jgi:hypothetical protein